jgi:2-polyprenyl-3-methyl-5-hydroxy-6-metoxy-1,4-benzoquinol methylase
MKKRVFEKDDVIIEYCRNKKVLDVGCVGQDINLSNPHWLHQKIKNVAQFVHGVDTNLGGIKTLNNAGYTVYSTSEIGQIDVKYDIIHMGDVIEHVDNAVLFLEFYANYLNENGKIIVTTPNGNRINDTLSILFFGNFYINTEHTCWYCRITFSELCRRANLNIERFEWLNTYVKPQKGFINFTMNLLRRFFCFLRSDFYPNMLFILVKK